MLELPANFASSSLGQASEFLDALSPYVILIVGILLAVLVIEIIIGAIRR
jgi:hypothetical protein